MSNRSEVTANSLRKHQWIGTITVLLLVAGLGGWSAIASISGAVIAPSIVVVESNAKQVQHLEGGIVAEIMVKDGQQVKAGERLIRLDQTDTRASLGVIDAQLNELLSRLARLRAERDEADKVTFDDKLKLSVPAEDLAKSRQGQLKLFKSRQRTVQAEKDQLEQRVAQLNEEISGLKAQQNSRQKQKAFLEDELVGLRKLTQRGLVPKTRLLALERQAAEIEGERGQFTADMARARGRIAELKVQATQTTSERRNETLTDLRSTQASVAELLERRRAAVSRLARINIFAPRDGYVHNLSVHTVGGVIAPREPIMAIIPEQDALQIEARVDPSDIHRVFDGQSVVTRFSSLDAAKTPELKGVVSRVPAASSQADGQTPPYYIVRVSISDGELAKLNGQRLKPGMPAEVYIETGDRKAISYLLKPFTDALPKVFRGE